MKPEEYISECEDEDELRDLAKLRHPRDWQQHVETLGPFYWTTLDERKPDLDKLMRKLQQQAQKRLTLLKRKELEEDRKRQKENLQRRLEQYNELRKENKIIVWSRRKARVNFHDDGTFTHHCPGTYTDDHEQTHKCEEIHKISLIEEEELQPATQPFLTNILDEKSGKRVLTAPHLGPRVGTGNLGPIIDGIISGHEEILVIKCRRCNTADDLKITLRKD